MSGKPIYDPKVILEAYRRANKSASGAAKILGCAESTVRLCLRKADVEKPETYSVPPVTPPEFPDDDAPVDEIRAFMCSRYKKRETYQKSKDWFRVKVNIKGPIGVTFWGDPHVDDDGCHWP